MPYLKAFRYTKKIKNTNKVERIKKEMKFRMNVIINEK